MKKEIPQIPALEGVRGIAALMIMVFHGWQGGAFGGLGAVGRASSIWVFGQTGVDLFFVLSGFLITRILIATKGSPHYFKIFYTRRVLRIFPLYYLALVIYDFVLPLVKGQPIASFGQTWWYWVYLQNVPITFHAFTASGPGHFWSLGVEEHFYLLWPLLVYLLPVKKLHWLSLGIIIGAVVFRAIFIYGFGMGAEVFFFTPCRMDALAFGTLLACIEAAGLMARLKWVFLVAFLAVVPVLGMVWSHVTGEGSNWLQLSKFSFIAIAYFAAIGTVISFQNAKWVRLSLANKPLRFAGKISYGLYVYHPICFGFVFGLIAFHNHGLLALSAGMAATFLVSWASFRFFESYFLGLKKYFSYESRTKKSRLVTRAA